VDSGAVVVAFPADYERWIENGMLERAAAQAVTTETGSFALDNIRPGQYLVAALRPPIPANLQDPEFIRSIVPFAELVSLASGPNLGAAIRVAPLR
jgi:hypothetical protein